MRASHRCRLLALLGALCWLAASGPPASASRFNLFDPLFADDDSDVHTVSAGSNDAAELGAHNNNNNNNNHNNNHNHKKILEIRNTNTTRLASTTSRVSLPPTLIDDTRETLYPVVRSSSTLAATPSVSTAGRVESSLAGWSTRNPPTSNSKRHLTSLTLDTGEPPGSSSTSRASSPKQADKAEHWSALESYYETLRKNALLTNSQQLQPPSRLANPDADFYQIEQKLIDEWASRRNPPAAQLAAGPSKVAPPQLSFLPLFNQQQQQQHLQQPLSTQVHQLPSQAATKTSAWLFPSSSQEQTFFPVTSSQLAQQLDQQRQQQQRLNELLNGSKLAYLPTSSQTGGSSIGPKIASSLPTIKGNLQEQQQQQQQQVQVQVPIEFALPPVVLPHRPTHQQPQQQGAGLRPDFINQLMLEGLQPLVPSLSAGSQREWQRVAEFLYNQQQDNRQRHQMDTFGSHLDHRRFWEQIERENYCGPRNQIFGLDSGLLNLLAADSRGELSKGLDSARLRGLLVSAPPGEYPSHMGLYNGTTQSDPNFLCAATWVHERFALTLASCIPRGFMPNKQDQVLTLRAGEWAALKPARPAASPSTSASNTSGTRDSRDPPPFRLASSFVRPVKDVHVFPRHQANSSEHNLALLEWAEPTKYLTNFTAISPACSMQERRALSAASSCWTPVRNVTLSAYFDAEGEGETKLRRNVGMQEVPIRLLNDDTDCKRETHLDLYNFQHPNYICSADVKRAPWRAKLNETENFGSGIYCNDAGRLSLVSILHPVHLNGPSQFGYLDLTYYMPWMQSVITSSALG